MRSRSVTWVAAVILAAHGLLGCCWHHQHLHAVTTPSPESASPAGSLAPPRESSGKHCCHHHGSTRHDQPHEKVPVSRRTVPSPVDHPAQTPVDDPCTEDDCVFVAGPRVVSSPDNSLDTAPLATWWGLPAVQAPHCLSNGDVLRQSGLAFAPRLEGGLRAHRLRTGVWLI